MKKYISIILVGVCIVGLVGCGNKTKENTTTTQNQSVAQKENNTRKTKKESENDDEKNSLNPLIGKWSDIQDGTEMEVTEDCKLLRAGTEVATYEIVDENTVKIHNTQGEEIEMTYEIDGDTLNWGTNFEKYQEFTRINPVG